MLWPKYADLPNPSALRLGERFLYTDGSYNHGVSGWAVVELGVCILQDWSRGLTSNLAEGMAIQAALELLPTGPATIRSDSLAWVQALTVKGRMRGKPSKEVYSNCKDMLRPDIKLQWVPSHTGRYQGNELADEWARDARLNKVTMGTGADTLR